MAPTQRPDSRMVAIAITILGARLGGVPSRRSLLALPLTVRNLSVSGASLEREIMLVAGRWMVSSQNLRWGG